VDCTSGENNLPFRIDNPTRSRRIGSKLWCTSAHSLPDIEKITYLDAGDPEARRRLSLQGFGLGSRGHGWVDSKQWLVGSTGAPSTIRATSRRNACLGVRREVLDQDSGDVLASDHMEVLPGNKRVVVSAAGITASHILRVDISWTKGGPCSSSILGIKFRWYAKQVQSFEEIHRLVIEVLGVRYMNRSGESMNVGVEVDGVLFGDCFRVNRCVSFAL
jgi:hypothetical protein